MTNLNAVKSWKSCKVVILHHSLGIKIRRSKIDLNVVALSIGCRNKHWSQWFKVLWSVIIPTAYLYWVAPYFNQFLNFGFGFLIFTNRVWWYDNSDLKKKMFLEAKRNKHENIPKCCILQNKSLIFYYQITSR